MTASALLLSIAAVILATKLLGELARRFAQPAVFGEMLAGVILGGSVLALLDPHDPAIHALGQLGLFVLVFQIGLHADVSAFKPARASAFALGAAGAVVPFVLGYFAVRALGMVPLAAAIAGLSLAATSIVVATRVLADKGVLNVNEGRVALAAAFACDVIALIALSAVAAHAGVAGVGVLGVARFAAIAAGFIVVAAGAGAYVARWLFRGVEAIRGPGPLGMFGLAFGLLIAAAAAATGTLMIVGAFAAGLAFHSTPRRHEIERTTAQIGHFLVPFFCAVVGASIDPSALAKLSTLELAAALSVAGVVGKAVAGFALWRFAGSRLLAGTALVPRGEVGMIFAQVGLSTGAITPALFDAMILMVVVTTAVAPPLLREVIRRDESIERDDTHGMAGRGPEGRRPTTVGRRH